MSFQVSVSNQDNILYSSQSLGIREEVFNQDKWTEHANIIRGMAEDLTQPECPGQKQAATHHEVLHFSHFLHISH